MPAHWNLASGRSVSSPANLPRNNISVPNGPLMALKAAQADLDQAFDSSRSPLCPVNPPSVVGMDSTHSRRRWDAREHCYQKQSAYGTFVLGLGGKASDRQLSPPPFGGRCEDCALCFEQHLIPLSISSCHGTARIRSPQSVRSHLSDNPK